VSVADLAYHPVLMDAKSLIDARNPVRLLVVGTDVPEYVAVAAATRVIPACDPALPTGIYSFTSALGCEVLLLNEGDPPVGPTEASWVEDEDPLVRAYGWFSHWWKEASEVPHPLFDVGDDVCLSPSGQGGIVRSRRFVAGSWNYGVRVDGKTLQIREQALSPPTFDDDPEAWIARPPAGARRFAATLTRAKLSEQFSDTVFSFRASRTLFRPYQFRPVIRLLATGGLRLLIADEVGLGKTIEAGLVWTELDARGMANRVLVICPSMLVAKWRWEMGLS
jgi:hypothetical protein